MAGVVPNCGDSYFDWPVGVPVTGDGERPTGGLYPPSADVDPGFEGEERDQFDPDAEVNDGLFSGVAEASVGVREAMASAYSGAALPDGEVVHRGERFEILAGC